MAWKRKKINNNVVVKECFIDTETGKQSVLILKDNFYSIKIETKLLHLCNTQEEAYEKLNKFLGVKDFKEINFYRGVSDLDYKIRLSKLNKKSKKVYKEIKKQRYMYN